VRIEKIITLVFLALGVLLGFVSNYFIKTFNNLNYALTIPLLVYFIAQSPFMKMVKEKKKRWIFYNSFLTFALVWILAWIFLFNL
jgi:H+/Cl- antiporter ClcA